MNLYNLFTIGGIAILLIACQTKKSAFDSSALKPAVVTEQTPNDTDDPAIWIHPSDPTKSLVIGTDKDIDGGVYAFDLEGNIVHKAIGLKRPNNVDIAYGFEWNGKKIDIAVATERETNKIRVFRLPDLIPIDDQGIEVFNTEKNKNYNKPMGIALYTKSTDSHTRVFPIVGRKDGPAEGYLWQYELYTDENNVVKTKKIRSFGKYSGQKEIEAIAVDNSLGYVYYSDETAGIRKYYADPEQNDQRELAFFGQKDAKRDHEGIAIYASTEKTGYILVSDQQANKILIYPREGTKENKHEHKILTSIPVSTIEADGIETTNVNLGPDFPEGIFVAMTNGKRFHFYDWQKIQKEIDKALKE